MKFVTGGLTFGIEAVCIAGWTSKGFGLPKMVMAGFKVVLELQVGKEFAKIGLEYDVMRGVFELKNMYKILVKLKSLECFLKILPRECHKTSLSQ